MGLEVITYIGVVFMGYMYIVTWMMDGLAKDASIKRTLPRMQC